ncbi:MAG TPA: polysaccharide pyruvyl transferase family protein [Candidatus Paceibacterota bacterium]|nr:polysaccharide pyruvyl transferase family protein [Verrucomicrobiota bacterium]HRY46431.1 polysaccharide pyruvyl transferase family protein [Candidatus Paceibacterota bacterium]HRZ99376.1 polysaccharide pyruvyl transferase family protein [Candidatus Paceibacterota bacterium]
MKIVITGITSFRNHGVEALVTTTIEQLRQRLPGTSFLVLDRMPEFDSSRIKSPDVKFKLDETIRPLYSSRLRRALLQLSDHVEALGREYQATIRDLQNATAVVASGGDIFCSEYGHQSLLSHLAPLNIARQAGIPFFIHAQSIGPFKNESDRRAFLAVARSAAHITVRERMTFDYMIGQLGFPERQVTLTADPAFLLSRTDASWREHFRFAGSKPLVALSTSQAVCNWMGSDYADHFRSWCRVIEWLRRELDANLILIPHVQELSTKNDDRILATDLARHYLFDPHLQIAGGDFSASDFKGIISQCDLVVAERMHAAIAGLSSGIPTVVIGYSVKGEGILTDLLGAQTVQESVLIPLKTFLDATVPQQRITKAWEDRASIKARIEQQLPGTRRLAALSFDVIAKHLQTMPGKSIR